MIDDLNTSARPSWDDSSFESRYPTPEELAWDKYYQSLLDGEPSNSGNPNQIVGPSNRTVSALPHTDAVVTIDTVSWGLTLPPNYPIANSGILMRYLEPGASRDLSGGRNLIHNRCVTVLAVRSTNALKVTFTASLPKFLYGDNIDGLPVSEVLEAIEDVEDYCADIVHLPGSARFRTVFRIDVVRDFRSVSLTQRHRLLQGLAADRTRRQSATTCYTNTRGRSAGTLIRGAKYARYSLYDKDAEVERSLPRCELDGAAKADLQARARDRLRAELNLRTRRLRTLGIKEVCDIDPSVLSREAKRNFDNNGFGAWILPPSAYLQKVVGLDLTPAIRNGLVGSMYQESQGVDPGLSPAPTARYRKLARDGGLVLDTTGGHGAIRLDFETGRVEVEQ